MAESHGVLLFEGAEFARAPDAAYPLF